jgi:hypothetical protein
VKAVKQYGRVNSNTSSAIAFNFTSKADAKEIKCQIAMGTMSMMKQVVNETAYVLQGQRKEFEGAELAEMKIVRSYSMSY